MESLRDLKERAEALAGRGKWQLAAQQFARLVEKEPKDPRLQLRLGEAQRKLGKRQEAAVAFRAAARALAAAGQFARARAALNLALSQLPGNETLKVELVALDREAAERSARPMLRKSAATELVAPQATPFAPPAAISIEEVVIEVEASAAPLEKAAVTADLMPEDVFEQLYVHRRMGAAHGRDLPGASGH